MGKSEENDWGTLFFWISGTLRTHLLWRAISLGIYSLAPLLSGKFTANSKLIYLPMKVVSFHSFFVKLPDGIFFSSCKFDHRNQPAKCHSMKLLVSHLRVIMANLNPQTSWILNFKMVCLFSGSIYIHVYKYIHISHNDICPHPVDLCGKSKMNMYLPWI